MTVEQRAARIRAADRPGDLGWIVQAHDETYAGQLGWTTEFEALVARVVADFSEGRDPALDHAWIAEVDGDRAGSVMLTRGTTPDEGVLRVLLVDPAARGLGLGRALVAQCLETARALGHRSVSLWTVAGLDSARRIYESFGFELVDEVPQHRFGHDVVGQTWRLALG